MNRALRSPLEAAIDKVCGYEPDGKHRIITLLCPGCGKEQQAPADETDPLSAVIVIVACPDCVTGDRGGVKKLQKAIFRHNRLVVTDQTLVSSEGDPYGNRTRKCNS